MTASTRSQVVARGLFGRLIRKPLAAVSLAVLTIIVLATVFAGAIAPYGPDEQDLLRAFQGPSGDHWLGTGELGKDVFSRLLYGGRVTLVSVLISTGVYLVLGLTAGIAAGYLGGWIDRIVLRAADLVYAIPGTIVLLVVLAVFPNDERIAMVVLGLVGAPALARVVRAVTRSVRNELYVRAARANGLSGVTIMRRHILPSVLGPTIVQLSLFGAAAVGLETGLGFLGLGSRQVTWGSLVGEASANLGRQPWLLVPSGTLIVVYIVALGLVGDGARDAAAERYAPTVATPGRRRAATAPIEVDGPAEGPDSAALLSVRGLHVAFPIDGVATTVVRDVSFDLQPGEALGVVGESGCGKTVTVAAVVGLLRGGGRITAGSVHFGGVDLTAAPDDHLRRVRGGQIGWISQDPIAALDPVFTVGSQLAEVVRAHRRCTRAEARQRVQELLAEVRLPDPQRVARSYPHQLSGGMAQRVGIAAALAGDPAMVIADEPTTALDVTVQADILDLLRSLQQRGTAVILVTHDWGVLADLCTRALVMYAGEIVEVATVAAAVHQPGHPYTAGLLASNPHQATPGEPLPQIPGVVPAPAEWPAGCHFQGRCPLATAECATPVDLLPVAPGADHLARCFHTDQVSVGLTAAAVS